MSHLLTRQVYQICWSDVVCSDTHQSIYAQTEENQQLLECTAVTDFQSHSRCLAVELKQGLELYTFVIALFISLKIASRLGYTVSRRGENMVDFSLHSWTCGPTTLFTYW